MTSFMNVRELEIDKHETFEYIIATIYFTRIFIADKKPVREVIRREIHLIDNLKINMLIENDILRLESIFIDDVNSKATIFSCNMMISIKIRTLFKEMINKSLHARFITIISSHSMMIILIHSSLSAYRNFLFESTHLNVSLFAHIIDSFITVIMTKNDFSKSIKITRNDRVEMITKILYLNAFHVESSSNLRDYVEKKSRETHQKS